MSWLWSPFLCRRQEVQITGTASVSAVWEDQMWRRQAMQANDQGPTARGGGGGGDDDDGA